MSGAGDIVRELRDLAAQGHPVALSSEALAQIATYVAVADARYDEAGQILEAAGAKLVRAARLRRQQWWILAAQVVIFAVWTLGLWGWR